MAHNSAQVRTIGIMSGTSLDAIDIACIDFVHSNNTWSHNILCTQSISIPITLKQQLKNVYRGSAIELAELHYSFSNLVAEFVSKFIDENSISSIDVVGFHGQTIFHNPSKGYTFQLGNPGVLAAKLGIDVVGDFRSQDVALGGQGAPLVPIGDKHLFEGFDAFLNLGGIANISFTTSAPILAFDICPFNLMLNHFAEGLGLPYDDKGKIASTGKVNLELLQKLNDIYLYQSSKKHSLGFEEVDKIYLPLCLKYDLSNQDHLATYTAHAVEQIAKAINLNSLQKVLVSGGGAYNDFFIQSLKQQTNSAIVVPSPEIIEFKEAIIFGFLAALRITNRKNVLAEITGATHSTISGALYSGTKK